MTTTSQTPERWEQIDQLVSRFTQAMNDRNATAVAACFAPDANFTNPIGRSAKGREAIAALHAPLFTEVPTAGLPSFYKAVLQVTKATVHFIKPDVATIDILWEQTGVIAPDGTPIALRKGLINTVAVDNGGQWSFAVFHNMELKN